MPQELIVLALSCGMVSADLSAALEKLKDSSKSIGSHQKRRVFWDAYSKMSSKAGTMRDGEYAFLKYVVDTAPGATASEGVVEVLELTKRQKGLVGCVLGPKFKPPEDPSSNNHVFIWSGEKQRGAGCVARPEPRRALRVHNLKRGIRRDETQTRELQNAVVAGENGEGRGAVSFRVET